MSENAAEEQERVAKRALIAELELTLWPGVQRTFDVLKKVLKKRKFELDEVGFRRFFLGSPLRRGFSQALASRQLDGDLGAMISEAQEQLVAALCVTDDVTGLKELLKVATEDAEEVEGVLCFVSSLEPEQSKAMLEVLGLDPEETPIVKADRSAVCTTSADVWKRALREVGASPRLSTALVSSAGSSKGALSAGLRVAACANAITTQGDFSGADVLVEDTGAEAMETLSELVRRS